MYNAPYNNNNTVISHLEMIAEMITRRAAYGAGRRCVTCSKITSQAQSRVSRLH